MPADPAALAEAIATVRENAHVDPDSQLMSDHIGIEVINAHILLARYVAEHAGELVRVRGLEWYKPEPTIWRADVPGGHFEIQQWPNPECNDLKLWVEGMIAHTSEDHSTVKAAKQEAETVNRARLAAALEPLLPEVRT